MANTILITGCSSGIGLQAAITLKERGYRVFASARKPEDVAKLKAQGFESVQLDVTQIDSIEQALNDILTKTGGTLDALFNNAGYMQAGAIEDLTPEIIQQQFATNTFGPIELTRRILPIMRKQGHGRIIQNSSVLGVFTVPFYGAYNASKFALEGFSNTLRQELRGTGIFVSIINPGPIKSHLRDTALEVYEKSIPASQPSHYRSDYEQIKASVFNRKHNPRHQNPDIVINKLIQALESRHPKAHYFPGGLATMLGILRRILPDSALDWLASQSK
jgi:NAD(P)-dependent dehydrogenase (short-subunit alcohol dehydrogenase family)